MMLLDQVFHVNCVMFDVNIVPNLDLANSKLQKKTKAINYCKHKVVQKNNKVTGQL